MAVWGGCLCELRLLLLYLCLCRLIQHEWIAKWIAVSVTLAHTYLRSYPRLVDISMCCIGCPIWGWIPWLYALHRCRLTQARLKAGCQQASDHLASQGYTGCGRCRKLIREMNHETDSPADCLFLTLSVLACLLSLKLPKPAPFYSAESEDQPEDRNLAQAVWATGDI